MGVSQWKLIGKRYGYWDYFEEEVRKKLIELLPKEKEFPDSKNGCGCGVCNQIEYGNNLIKKIRKRFKELV